MSPISIPGKVQLRKNYSGIGPLDFYGGAAAAYSLRSLSAAYTGPVVRVRRDNDNAASDFTAKEVSDGTLAAWVGAGNNGLVRTWYDQSGNGNEAGQSVYNNQPAIVLSGSLIMQGSKPAISMGAVTSDNKLGIAGGIPASTYTASMFIAAKSDIASYSSGTGSDRLASCAYDGSDNRLYFGTNRNGATQSILSGNYGTLPFELYSSAATFGTNPFVFSSTATPTFAVAHFNSQQCFSGSISPTNTGITSQLVEFGGGGNGYWDGVYQEILLYQSDQSSNRAAIEDNINTYYSIF